MRHLRFNPYPCGGTTLVAFDTNTNSCAGTALAVFEVLIPTLVAGQHW